MCLTYFRWKELSSGKKVWTTLEVTLRSLIFRDQKRIQETLDFGFLVHGLWSRVWISIPFVMAVFGPSCSTKKHERYLFTVEAHAGLCLSPSFIRCSRPLWHKCLWFCQKPSSGPFSRFKPSHLKILISSHQVGWSLGWWQLTMLKSASNGGESVQARSIWSCHYVRLFLINPGNGHDLCLCDHLLAAVLSIIMKIVYPLFTEVFETYDNLNNIKKH